MLRLFYFKRDVVIELEDGSFRQIINICFKLLNSVSHLAVNLANSKKIPYFL